MTHTQTLQRIYNNIAPVYMPNTTDLLLRTASAGVEGYTQGNTIIMAYKSQVTNKYMGSSFAGRVNPGRENELTQLAKSLDQFADAFPRGVAAYKNNK